MAQTQTDSLVGRTVDGRYDVRAHIADGGMGSVYAALDTRLDREVALKVMRPELARDADFVARFRREARAAASLSHPHVVAVYDQGEDDGLCFLAMEFVDGQTLRDRLAEVGALTPREALDTTAAVLEALRAAHRKDLVHRDIKPENVLLSAESVVKVADFGLARAVTSTTATGRTGPLLGTVAYLAPEQVEHGTADHRSDLYCVGLLLHEMLTGRPAVAGDSPIHIAWQHVNGTLAAPSDQVEELPTDLDDLVAGATRRDPQDRFEDATAFLAALRTTRMALADDVLDHRPDVQPTPADGAHTATVLRDGDTRTLHRETTGLPRVPAAGGSGSTAAMPVAAANAAEEETPAPTRRGGRRATVLVALLLALLAAGGAGYWWFGPPGERTVPELTAVELASAESALREQDLVPRSQNEFSETAAAGTVIRTDHPAGSVVRRGTPVTLVVSQGPERYEVPDVTGASLQEATELITAANLAVAAEATGAYDERIPEGSVISADPAVGTPSPPGTEVTLTVSQGREPIEIDGVVGTALEGAQQQLEEAGLRVEVATDRPYDTEVPEGSVLSTSPEEGPLYQGDTITLVVSAGPEMVEIPDVRGENATEAEETLREAGFDVSVNRIAGGIFGTAHSTEPARGTAPKGSTVVLNIV